MNGIDIQNLSVRFDDFLALDDISLHIPDQGILCLIGPNGAGKTTMVDAITGQVKATQGNIYFHGQTINQLSEVVRAQMGIGRKFQHPVIFNELSVIENLELVSRAKRPWWQQCFHSDSKRMSAKIDSILERIGLAQRVHDKAFTLPHGQRQWLEIGILLAMESRYLFLDEPVTGMTEEEIVQTVALIRELSECYSLVIIDHDMSFIRSIGDKVVVLNQGKILCTGSIQEIQKDDIVRRLYLGESDA